MLNNYYKYIIIYPAIIPVGTLAPGELGAEVGLSVAVP
jgi:hypothetical protein